MTKRSLLLWIVLVPVIAAVFYALGTGAFTGTVKDIGAMSSDIDKKLTAELEVKTDRSEYPSGAPVQVTVRNTLAQPVLSHFGSQTPIVGLALVQRRGADGTWQPLFPYCRYPHCTYKEDSPHPIDPGKSETYRWVPVAHPEGKPAKQALEPGTYRLIVRYKRSVGADLQDWQYGASSEFVLR